MSDLKLDSFGDLDLGSGGFEIVDGTDAIIQHLRIRLQFVKGEWFLDTRLGIPYFEDILTKAPNLIAVRGIFSRAIADTPGVLELGDITLDFAPTTRRLTVNFSALLDGSDTPLDFSEVFIL